MSVHSSLPFETLIAEAATHRRAAVGWLSGLRDGAARHYAEAGWPHARTEAWKYTNLNALAAGPFTLATTGETAIPEERVPQIDAPRIVLVNGVLCPALSDLDDLPGGVAVTRLCDGDPPPSPDIATLLEARPSGGAIPLASLNGLLFREIIVLEIADGAQVEGPVHVVSLGACLQGGFAPRLLVRAGRGSAFDLLESHVGDGPSGYFANAVVQITAGPGAVLGHYKVQNEAADAFHIALTTVEVAQGARYDNFAFSLGGRLARNEIRGLIAGADVDYRVNGAYLATADQHLDTTTFIDHAAAGSRSREVYKGVLAGSARGVFQGKILVRPVAQRTDGYQMNQTILLSDRAEIDCKPELEIYADDVRCSHGATVGTIDDEQVFYLLSRGIPRPLARRLLVAAHVEEALDEIRAEAVRDAMKVLMVDWLAANLPGETA